MKKKECVEVNMQPQKKVEEIGLKDFTVEDLKSQDRADDSHPSLFQADPINEIYPLGIEVEDDGPKWS